MEAIVSSADMRQFEKTLVLVFTSGRFRSFGTFCSKVRKYIFRDAFNAFREA